MNTKSTLSTKVAAVPSETPHALQIIIADDEPVIREFLKKACRYFGHDVIAVAKNGQELIDLCQTTVPDLIVTDIAMPEIDGLTALQTIRKTVSIKSIVISAYDHPDLRAQAAALGACAYLVKPIGISDLGPALAQASSS